uniref:NADH-ubiquinone oxidoreductase chain 4 n=1 Tax=Limnadia lenticularis TaxID=84336 RepID=A0A3G1RRX7_9CRUS|nr:NADH dehydrogenase subunit 4 [Limnadia lenticularis]AXH81656.1 NADH dehydrogenase subunit 4 [Limnadia lenticularis]
MLSLMLSLIFSLSLSPKNWIFTIMWLSGLMIILPKEWSFNMMNYNFMLLDNISFSLTTLSVWICILMIMSSFKIKMYKNMDKLFMVVLISLLFSLFGSFTTSNLLTFYIMFETSLIPTALLILGWGYQPERWQAFIYLLFYTLFASLPLLATIFWVMELQGSLEMPMLHNHTKMTYSILFVTLNLAFLVKLPIYFCHSWLPKAHVEAPIAGSMILAGVLLKLGGYGLMRCLPLITSSVSKIFNPWLMSMVIWGGVFASMICLRQNDTKSLIAYSSVAHMSLVCVSILTLFTSGWLGALMMMIAHGLISSALFCLANIIYERSGSRSLLLNKGFISLMPSMSPIWFLAIACSMAAPPSLNFISEIILVSSSLSFSLHLILPIAVISFLSAAYSLYLFSNSQHGSLSKMCVGHSGKVQEFLIIFSHLWPCVTLPLILSSMTV